MKKKLIAFRVEGVKELGNFFHHFLAESQKTPEEREEQLIRLFEDNWEIYMNKFNLIHGMNASGKTQFLDMINAIDSLSYSNWNQHSEPRIDFSFFNTFEKPIKVISFFVAGNFVFKQKIKFTLEKEILNGALIDTATFNKRSILNIKKEELSVVEIKETHFTGDLINLMEDDNEWKYKATSISITPNISEQITLGAINTTIPYSGIGAQEYVLKMLMIKEEGFQRQGAIIESDDFENLPASRRKTLTSLVNKLNLELKKKFEFGIPFVIPENLPGMKLIANLLTNRNVNAMDFISIFDKSIKSITYDASLGGVFTVSFEGGKNVRTTVLNGILSSGTIRGLAVLSIIVDAIGTGDDIYIDELESNFNNKIIKFIMSVLKDQNLNKGSRLFASTHYAESLDTTYSRDSIFITEYKDRKRSITKLSDIEDIKKVKSRKADYKNSKLLSMINTHNIEPTYEDFVKFKKKINGK